MQLKFRLELDGINSMLSHLDNMGVAIWSLMESVQNQTAVMNQIKNELEEVRKKGIPTWKKV